MKQENKLESEFLTIGRKDGVEATLSTLGAGVYSLHYKGIPMILELADREEYLSCPMCFGKTLGRVAGRIPSSFRLGEEDVHLKEEAPGICLHGGCDTSLTYQKFHSEVVSNSKGTTVFFMKESKDGENGFPGNLKVEISYFFPVDREEMTITFRALSDKDTVVNLSNHMYFNFAGSMDINDYHLHIDASNMASFKEGTELPNGIVPVCKALDFHDNPRMGERMDATEKEIPLVHNFDHFLAFDIMDPRVPQVTFSGNGFKMDILTDYEGVNCYCDQSMKRIEFNNRLGLMKRRALAIEPEKCNFPLEGLLLKAGQEYKHFATYRFSLDK